MKMDEDTYVVAYRDYDPNVGHIKLMTISPDGKTITEEDSERIFLDRPETGNSGDHSSLIQLNSNNFMLQTRDKDADGWLYTYKVADDGKSMEQDWKFEFEDRTMYSGVELSLIHI